MSLEQVLSFIHFLKSNNDAKQIMKTTNRYQILL